MRYIGIPNTDLRPSVICLGTVHVGSTLDRRSSYQLLDGYLQQGGNFLDSAKVYSDWRPGERSSSEKMLGRWLKLRRNRDEVILATKGGHPQLSTMNVGRMSRQRITYDLNRSLKQLQTDVIDLYWLHRDDPCRPVEEIIDTLDGLRKAGKIRYFGCSNWSAARIRASEIHARRRGIQGFVADQMMWSLAPTRPKDLADKTMVVMDGRLRRYHLQSGLTAVAYSSQAGGLFQKMAQMPCEQLPPSMRRVAGKSANKKRFKRIKQVASDTGLSVTQVVLGYLLSQPFVTIPIVGPRTIDQLQDSLSAADTQLTEAQIGFLDGIG
jgi:aryl-alcohol dehydrogenase-like predicted oxidoreductase